VANAGPEVLAVEADGPQGLGDGGQQVGLVDWATVGEHSLGELPDSLVGVQFRGVAWEANQVKARNAAGEVTDEASGVGRTSVPQEVDVTAQVP